MNSSIPKIIIVIFLIFAPHTGWAKDKITKSINPYESGLAAYKKNDIVTAIMIWLPLAESGDKNSQFILGKIYLERNDPTNAVYWYQKAAEQGHMEAQTTLGQLYLKGDQIDKKPDLAAKYLLMAIRNKQASTSKKLTTTKTKKKKKKKSKTNDYDKGLKAYNNKDYISALMHWLPLGNAGDPDAEYMIGKMYLEQQGERKNSEKAIYWFKRSADKGHLQAQTTLGHIYYDGIDTEASLAKSANWFLKASRNKNKSGSVKRRKKYQPRNRTS